MLIDKYSAIVQHVCGLVRTSVRLTPLREEIKLTRQARVRQSQFSSLLHERWCMEDTVSVCMIRV